eukprot:199531-Rhodomonas_salina.3
MQRDLPLAHLVRCVPSRRLHAYRPCRCVQRQRARRTRQPLFGTDRCCFKPKAEPRASNRAVRRKVHQDEALAHDDSRRDRAAAESERIRVGARPGVGRGGAGERVARADGDDVEVLFSVQRAEVQRDGLSHRCANGAYDPPSSPHRKDTFPIGDPCQTSQELASTYGATRAESQLKCTLDSGLTAAVRYSASMKPVSETGGCWTKSPTAYSPSHCLPGHFSSAVSHE